MSDQFFNLSSTERSLTLFQRSFISLSCSCNLSPSGNPAVWLPWIIMFPVALRDCTALRCPWISVWSSYRKCDHIHVNNQITNSSDDISGPFIEQTALRVSRPTKWNCTSWTQEKAGVHFRNSCISYIKSCNEIAQVTGESLYKVQDGSTLTYSKQCLSLLPTFWQKWGIYNKSFQGYNEDFIRNEIVMWRIQLK